MPHIPPTCSHDLTNKPQIKRTGISWEAAKTDSLWEAAQREDPKSRNKAKSQAGSSYLEKSSDFCLKSWNTPELAYTISTRYY